VTTFSRQGNKLVEVTANVVRLPVPAVVDEITSGSESVAVIAGADDTRVAEGANASAGFRSDSLSLAAGHIASDYYYYRSAMRLVDVQIPQGATITSAVLKLEADSNTLPFTEMEVRIQGVDDTVAPTSEAEFEADETELDTAQVLWTPTEWTAGTIYSSPDISALIQAVVDRPGWKWGNAMQLFVRPTSTAWPGGDEYQAWDAFEDAGVAPTLEVNYTTPKPPVPTGLTATVNQDKVLLDWAAVIAGDFKQFNVYRSTTTPVDLSQAPIAAITDNTITSYTDTTATLDTLHYYVVTQVDTSGNESPASNEVSATPSLTSGVTLVTGTGTNGYQVDIGAVSAHTYTVNLPAAVASGDVLIIGVTVDRDATVSSDGGIMTEAVQLAQSMNPCGSIWYRRLTATDISNGSIATGWSLSVADGPGFAHLFLTGVDSVSPVSVTDSLGTEAASISLPDFTTSESGAYAVIVATCDPDGTAKVSVDTPNSFATVVYAQGGTPGDPDAAENGDPAVFLLGRELPTAATYASPALSNNNAQEMLMALAVFTKGT
jgi:hypothetical protein